jgi:ABC-type glycerol-3-phosphate transport system substrate-binding protein
LWRPPGQPSGPAATSGFEAGIARDDPDKAITVAEQPRRHKGVYFMSKSRRLTRRRALQLATATTALPLVHIRTAGAAGQLKVGFWDHWVPGGTEKMRQQVEAWANKNKVDVTADFITSQGNKLLLTAAAEAQAKTGHDFLPLFQWDAINYSESLEPVDDVIQSLSKKYGKYDPVVEYLAKPKDNWVAVPGTDPTTNLTCCARISMMKNFAGIDVQAMYPAEPHSTPLAAEWTFDAFLKAAEACAKAGFPFGMGLGSTGDSINNTGSMFRSFGADLVNAKGEITVDSDSVRKVLEYGQKLVKFFPADTVSYDDASNNRALISGRSALIYNPPSAYAVAKRDAPDVAKDCWTFPCPAGPNGRYIPYVYVFYGIWKFAKNKVAAKELLEHLQERKQIEERAVVSEGFNLPPQVSMSDFNVWAEVEPPKGTVYNYPIRPWHNSLPSIAGFPAPPEIAIPMFNRATIPTMWAKLHSGQSIDQVIAWAKDEIEGFMR